VNGRGRKRTTRLDGLAIVVEQMVAVGMEQGREGPADQFPAVIAVQGGGGGIGLNHQTGLGVVDEYPVADMLKDVAIRPFCCFILHEISITERGPVVTVADSLFVKAIERKPFSEASLDAYKKSALILKICVQNQNV
jgi:hypothetical protein